VQIRDAKDVARRVIILYAVGSVVFEGGREESIKFLKEAGLWDYVSPSEVAFLENQKPSEQETADVIWRMEALWMLLWAMGKVKELDLPTKPCDLDMIHELVPKRAEVAQYINSATLKTKSEILDHTDMIYRIHWAVRDAQLNKKPIPAGLDADVVVERHYALNWLVFYADDWDDITTDT